MKSLKEALKELSKPDRDLLNYAFETGDSEYIVIGEYFIGVNINNSNLVITEQIGAWSIGHVNKT